MKEIEFFDVYDENKVKTGKRLERRNSFLAENEYELIVLALVETPDRRFLITRRALDKRWAAGHWEISGGGVLAGETSREAIEREVLEETGLDVRNARGTCIYTYCNTDLERGDNYFVDIYHFVMDFSEKDVSLQESEAIDFHIVPFSEITRLYEDGKFLHYKRILEAFAAEGYRI